MSLQLSSKFSLPKEAALWTFAFLAIKGAGKTYDASKLAEQMIKAGIPIVVLDPMGIWWGLRVGVGPSEGLPVVIFGGDHADLQIPTTLSKDKRHQIIEEDKLRQAVVGILQAHLSVVLDTSQLSITQQTRAVSIFCDTLYHKNAPYGIRHVFIEEADEYCPQEPKGEKQASKEAIDQLVRRGGNPNIGVTMITQRAAVLNKNVLSQTSCLFVLRIQWMKDKNTIREWVKDAVKDEREVKKLAKWYDSLKELKNGEAWVYSPEHDLDLIKVQFGERDTLHATREYFLQETWEQKNITLKDVSLFVKAYKAKIEPKPTVKMIQPSVVSALSSKDSGYAAIEHETAKKTTVGQTIDKTIGRPTDRGRETVGETPSQIHNQESALDKMEMRLPSEQETEVQVHLSSPGPSTGTGRTQYEPTLAETSETKTIDILRSNPVIQTQRSKVSLVIPSDVDHPKTALGKLGVIMKDDSAHSQHWTPTRARKQFAVREWPVDGLEEAFNQMIAWGILTIQSNRAYSCKLSRIEITEKTVNVIAP